MHACKRACAYIRIKPWGVKYPCSVTQGPGDWLTDPGRTGHGLIF